QGSRKRRFPTFPTDTDFSDFIVVHTRLTTILVCWGCRLFQTLQTSVTGSVLSFPTLNAFHIQEWIRTTSFS
ncbi:MAG TPA: hypothetical protein VE844_13105, partial [Gammaproteobacteria bacterium]|nr:hypothetical protein [Gammaproteobacteria bacterium]